ncbi:MULTISPECIES: tyrosine--tRNA ligase [Halobacterium]|uniref:Tyrosine--tRNA ligase n=4 Tax=Halobacterium salinarum TaxID=2242 RepID=SYY_HALSA|nr:MULTISPECIES: tyrosine--tRNA ligase [Halobacterium]B0R7E0.1 RecName: Full=Tyrosine--tRNA ligase; AltName: Full=Tyrosyl-tRNA synthetase; Short=TyrRS [Halobacterium salinarum R1]Q9HN62.1 RecName: Full=Tyrosine--tRNA ligase; AltName: Full=Tyrosyl-tRNA synthetase; Short=TyrRS [Halobacterium salinarum NRC-1]AAG20359.1 tyrosyl-tRNA synthetase [Halobacterium salinarum NRC-1]MBB6089716.1 tyrosyl-tRNA synthetase [Halobacterium salinarum]MDL0119897.1 tyrosine--tRNA ligase [Halobacterium salinarum]MD
MNAYERITRNTAEVVTEEEVRELAEDPEGKRVYVGYEPSGVLHLGHLLTANKLMDLQDAGMEVVVLLADVHAYLNDKGSFEEIRATADQMKAQFLAYGLDEDQTEFVLGSSFQLDEDYELDLHAMQVETSLKRAQRAMAEIQSGETPKVSHVVYPLMQALDIEYLDLDLAIGGMDQRKVHMLAREELPSVGYEKRPVLHTPIIGDLGSGDGKMSSSEGVTISMEDSTADIEEKVTGAFCPQTRDPEGETVNPVLELFQYHVFPRFDEVVVQRPDEYGGDLVYESYEDLADDLESGELHPADAKGALAAALDELIEPGRQRLREIRGE